jgi:hypothetical protein
MTNEQEPGQDLIAMAIEIAKTQRAQDEKNEALLRRAREQVTAEQARFADAVFEPFAKRWPKVVELAKIELAEGSIRYVLECDKALSIDLTIEHTGEDYRILEARLIEDDELERIVLYATPPDAPTFEDMTNRLGMEVAKWVALRLDPEDYDPTAAPTRKKKPVTRARRKR